MSYLLDTNVISEYAKKQPNKNLVKWLDSIPNKAQFISVLTIGEIKKGITGISEMSRREKLSIWLEYDVPNWFQDRILSIDQKIAERWGEVLGKIKRPLPAIDSLLAATALQHGLKLVTRNIKDFEFASLEVINPWIYTHYT